MKIFLLDLWHDLQEKRLWPVAAVLLAGLVAVPVLLAKPAGNPSPPAIASEPLPKQAKDQMAALAKVTLGEEQSNRGSTLGVFDPSDPFKPPKKYTQEDSADSGSAAGPGTGSDATGGGPGGTGTGAPSDGGTTGGVTAPGGTTAPGGGTGGNGGTTTTTYKYVVDVTFEANGRTRRIKGLEKMDMLPNEAAPLLIFMGVTAKGDDAVFLVDSTLDAAGEGRCKPTADECAFAYIGAGAEYVFTEDDGDTYTIKIDEIRKVEVGASASKAKGAKARASVGPSRRFVPPVLADLVVVASDQLEDSTSDTDGR
jgi:hypothetical protein